MKVVFIDPQRASSDHMAHVNLFINRILTLLTEPLRQRIQRIRGDLQAYYETGLKRAFSLEPYGEPGTFYLRTSAMRIWRVPTDNLEFPLSMQASRDVVGVLRGHTAYDHYFKF